ncbi:MAG: aldehyde ferredoxin oxidoreductase C-terminal domain-containing protein [Candidatus Hodarchaeota archaeon]
MRLIRINVKTKEIKSETLPEKYKIHGGRELTSSIIHDEVDPKTNPLGRGNKLVIATGMLAGTPAPNFSRTSVGAKSPLTEGIKETNVGGKFAFFLGHHDIRAIIIEEKSEEFNHVIIKDDSVVLEDATDDKFLGNYELASKLIQERGKNIAIMCIGPAGAHLMNLASIAATDLQDHPSRHAGRGGLGAVMGSKGIKSIILHKRTPSLIEYKDKRTFLDISKEWSMKMKKGKAGFSRLGTPMTIGTSQTLQGWPTKNFSRGTFDDVEKMDGNALHELIIERKGRYGIPCLPGCAIQCSNLFIGPDGTHVTSGLEYESMTLYGSNLLISDLDDLARFDRQCDDLGVDTIEFGGMVGMLMEAGEFQFGNKEAIYQVFKEIRAGSEKGKFYGMGMYRVGKKLGVKRIPAVKKQGLAAYDPRTYKAMGVTMATSPMGADHTAGAAIYKRPGIDPTADYGDVFENREKLRLSFELQILNGTCDMLGCCYFVGPSIDTLERVSNLIKARYGWSITKDDFLSKSKQMLKKELEFNEKAGITKEDNRLADFFYNEILPPSGRIWDIPAKELEDFWKNKLD